MDETRTRSDLVTFLADTLAACRLKHPLRVAVDGIDAAGKTSLADELADLLQSRGRPVIRASIDGFHNPRDSRYRLGPDSPEGYYRDSFNHQALISQLLSPLGPSGSRHYRRRVFDHLADKPVRSLLETADPDSVLLLDGVFLHIPSLTGFWDISIFLQVDFDTALSRAITRDLPEYVDPAEIRALQQKYTHRYFPGQRIYLRECKPLESTHVVINNNDLQRPRLVKFNPCTSS